MKTLIFLFMSTLCLSLHPAWAQTLDNSFGMNGRVTTPVQGVIKAIAAQSDGKLVAAGYSSGNNQNHIQLIRYNNDGSLDNGFGTGGLVSTEVSFYSSAEAVIIQPDGKILIGGTYHTGDFANIYHLLVARYLPNGTLDNTFGTNGLAMPEPGFSEELTDMVLQQDGKIVVGGGFSDDISMGLQSFMVARFNANGSLDQSFGTSGITVTAINTTSQIVDIALQADGKIIAAGRSGLYDPNVDDYMDFTLARYTSQGLPDATFGTNGIVKTNVINSAPDILQSMILQPDGKIVAAGSYGSKHYMVRYIDNGSLDSPFGTNGIAVHTGIPARLHLARRSNGKLITAGAMVDDEGNSDFLLNGYLDNGTTDNSFGGNGTLRTDFPTAIPEGSEDYSNCIIVLNDGKFVLAGSADGRPALARYTTNDPTSVKTTNLTEDNITIFPNPATQTLNIKWSGESKTLHTQLSLLNILGQSMYNVPLLLKTGNNKVNIPNLAAGNYILCITTDEGERLTRKITIK
jgi:uncharacterized delta-60 repeat protein